MEFQKLGISEVCDRLETYESYLLLMHSSPDGDTFGSCTALSYILAEMGKKSYLVYPDRHFPEYLTPFLSVPVYSPTDAAKLRYDAAICVDVASPAQLRDNYEIYKDKIFISIDHHSNGSPMSDYLLVPDASATGEIIYDIATELIRRNRISALPIEASEALYLSICSDTGSFKYTNVTPKTHRIAASLIEAGVRHAYINATCFDSKSPKQIEAEKIVYNNLHVLLGGRFVVAALDSKTKNGIANEHFENAVNIARSVRGALISCSIKEKDELPGEFRVSLRSVDTTIDVSNICAEFGGGGHVCAAGCSVLARNIEEATNKILRKVSEVLGDE